MAHVYFESGDHVNGLAWLDDWLPGTDQKAMFGGHLVWHAALHHLAIGDGDGALARYPLVRRLRGGRSADRRTVAAVALPAARPHAARHRPGAAARERAGRGLMDGVPFTFLGMHAALALATAGDADGLRRFADNARGFDAPGAATMLPVLANGLAAFVEGDHAKAADTLLRFEPYVARHRRLARAARGPRGHRDPRSRPGRPPRRGRREAARSPRPRDSGLDSGLLAETVSGGRAILEP